MKRYFDYSDAELTKMTEEEINQLIEMECMVKGVSCIYFKPQLKELAEIPNPNRMLYEFYGIYFLDMDEVYEFVEFFSSCKSIVKLDYDYNLGHSYKYFKPVQKKSLNINQTECYDLETFESVKEDLKSNKEIEKYNSSLTDDFNKKLEEYEEIKKEVHAAIKKAQIREYEFENAKYMFQKYLSMSKGDIEIAKDFFNQTEYYSLLNRILEYYGGEGYAGTDRE